MGLQALWCDARVRSKIFEILQKRVSSEVSHAWGCPGMDLWCIFVLGTVKQALGYDYDRLKELVDEHRTLRQLLGRSDEIDAPTYGLQTIVDNVDLLSEEILIEIDTLVVVRGHAKF